MQILDSNFRGIFYRHRDDRGIDAVRLRKYRQNRDEVLDSPGHWAHLPEPVGNAAGRQVVSGFWQAS